ncbi:MAG TPA: hypothetical protein VFX65_15485 [Candidatus Limnocylindrales bacterium]|nr:hypothetical protein [Candidatus Limnocylindrales bacterium]
MRPRRPTRPALLVLPIVVAAVVLATFVRYGVDPGATPPSSVALPGELPPHPGDGPWNGVAWQPVADPFPAGDPVPNRVDGLATGAGLIVGWGRVATPGRNQFNDMGAVFVSSDGLRWRSVALDDGVAGPDTSEPRGVGIGPLGLLAFGGVCCTEEERAIWSSADGSAWTRLPLAGELDLRASSFMRVVGTPTGWVAVGGSGAQAAIWHSADGAAWEAVDPVAAGLGRGQVSDVARTDDGTLIAVGTIDDAAGTHDGGVWLSGDGVEWRRVAAAEPSLTGPDETELWRVVPFRDGIFVVGNHGSHEDRVRCENLLGALASLDDAAPATGLTCGWGREHHWLSGDAATWHRLPPLDPLPGQPPAPGIRPIEFRLLVAAGPGVVNLGEDSQPPEGDSGLWVSPDGSAWRPVAAVGGQGPNAGASAFAVIGASLIAVGDGGQAAAWRPVFWTGRVIQP